MVESRRRTRIKVDKPKDVWPSGPFGCMLHGMDDLVDESWEKNRDNEASKPLSEFCTLQKVSSFIYVAMWLSWAWRPCATVCVCVRVRVCVCVCVCACVRLSHNHVTMRLMTNECRYAQGQ
jgi:hypothetical protein